MNDISVVYETPGDNDSGPGRSILVVEDDRKTADLVALYLQHAGHRASTASSGATAQARMERESFDLFILDVMLPGADGLTLCRQIRDRGATPIILLTAQSLEHQVLRGFELGADDYVTKPFSPRELVARVSALLRRAPPGCGAVLEAGGVKVELATRRVLVDSDEIAVTPSEFALLEALLEFPGRVLSRAQLLRRIPHRSGTPLERVVDVHVRNLRAKLARSDDAADLIETVFGVGYRCRV